MSEEEIIKYIKDEIENDTDTFHWFDDMPDNKTRKQIEESINAHQGLLDLYKQEKEKNKELEEGLERSADNERKLTKENTNLKYKLHNSISKDKIREKIKKKEDEYKELKQSSLVNKEASRNILIAGIRSLKELLEE